jgi:hypothetical protein
MYRIEFPTDLQHFGLYWGVHWACWSATTDKKFHRGMLVYPKLVTDEARPDIDISSMIVTQDEGSSFSLVNVDNRRGTAMEK